MHRTKLKNIYDRKSSDDNWAHHKKTQNFCVNQLG